MIINGKGADSVAKISEKQKEISEKKKASNKKWNDENMNTRYDHIHLALPAGYKEKTKAAAAQAGESVNEYIKNAIDQRMGK